MILLTYLTLILISLHGCSKQQEHKWLLYDLEAKKGVVYQGYKTTNKDSDAKEVEALVAVNDEMDQPDQFAKLDKFTRLDKPTIDEDDQIHFVVFGSMLDKPSCQFVETPYTQPHDSEVVPPSRPKGGIEALEMRKKRVIVCDLDVREKGSTKIDYTLLKSQKAKPEDIKGEDILLKDSVLVHELYRYRILAGPVFSTLQKRNKDYEVRQNSAGQGVITATAAQDSPANFALLLKAYHTKRDVLDPPSLFSNRWYETLNPIIGINLLDKPLENFYAGFSFEPWGGFDIIGGVHWGKTQQLVDGFSPGQVTTQTNGFTKERFTNGWFVGVAADIGVITTWLKSAGSGILTAIKTNP